MLYTIHFSDSLPGEPGNGCGDPEFYAEQTIEGTYKEAEAKAAWINHSEYYGDYHWWITPGPEEKSNTVVSVDEFKIQKEETKKKKLVILSGPSCVGKGPLKKALKKYHTEIKFAEPVLFTSRSPRLKAQTRNYEVHGVDYYFMPESIIRNLNPKDYIVAEVRSDVQAMDIKQIESLLQTNDLVIAELYYTLGLQLNEWIKNNANEKFDVISVSLIPLSYDEILTEWQKDSAHGQDFVYETMKGKLIRRGEDKPDKIEERARMAFKEIQEMHYYNYTIVNHAGEDDRTEWGDPLGKEASRVLKEFVDILKLELKS